VVLKAVPGYPCGPSGKLDLVKNDEYIGQVGFVEEAGEGREIGLGGGKNHETLSKSLGSLVFNSLYLERMNRLEKSG
jgi:hypothetical protein